MAVIEKEKLEKKKVLRWLVIGLPLAAIIGAGFLPLQPIVLQALIGIMLIWFQVSLMLGFFN
jgi:hypothetical protein